MNITAGVLYYNIGEKMICRLITSIHSLRKHNPDIPICLATQMDVGSNRTELSKIYNEIEKRYDVHVKDIQPEINKFFDDRDNNYDGKNRTYITATLAHIYTPFNKTIWLDSDTIVRKGIKQLYSFTNNEQFKIAQFAEWEVKGKIRKRVESFRGCIDDELIKNALKYKAAINCGLFAFEQNSELMRDWYDLAVKGRENFIPDEVACQIMLGSYPHHLLPNIYNVSCKYGDVYNDKNISIHYHGRKHCRFDDNGFRCGADLWYKEFEEVRDLCKGYIRKDRMLRKYIGKWDEVKEGK